MSSMSIVIGTLGSVIGYLGAEVATESFFERLLWPERFFNDTSPFTLLIHALFLPMSGPLHGAALKTLDTFRKNGLYSGRRRGNMLGTTFYHDTQAKYYNLTGPRTEDQERIAKNTRNGFWVQVLREVKYKNRDPRLSVPDSEDPTTERNAPYRAMQFVHHLKLHYAKNTEDAGANAIHINESVVNWKTVLGAVASEFSTIVIAIAAAVATPFKNGWLAGYLFIPLILKLVALCASVRRDSILDDAEQPEGHRGSEDKLYEIEDPSHSFAIIQGPPSVVLQFWRHYGHPKRDNGEAGRRDRARELVSIALIYLFMLYFPAGLVGSLWMPDNAQLLWLGFQVYTILTMHLVRIIGWNNCGRTEARIARHLEQGKPVWLRRPDGLGIVASLETIDASNMDRAKRELGVIISNFFQRRENDGANRAAQGQPGREDSKRGEESGGCDKDQRG